MLVEKFGDNVPLGIPSSLARARPASWVVVVGGLWKSPKVKRRAQLDLWSAFRSGRKTGRVMLKRFWIDTIPKNSWFRKRVHKLAFHLPASMVTTDRKTSLGGLGLKKTSRNWG